MITELDGVFCVGEESSGRRILVEVEDISY